MNITKDNRMDLQRLLINYEMRDWSDHGDPTLIEDLVNQGAPGMGNYPDKDLVERTIFHSIMSGWSPWEVTPEEIAQLVDFDKEDSKVLSKDSNIREALDNFADDYIIENNIKLQNGYGLTDEQWEDIFSQALGYDEYCPALYG